MLSKKAVLKAFPAPKVDDYLKWIINANPLMIWLSAAIDGEGDVALLDRKTISHGKKYRVFQPRVRVSNSDKNFVEMAHIACGEEGTIHTTKVKGYKDSHSLVLWSNALRKLLPEMRFVTKEKRRTLLIEALNLLAERIGTGSIPRSEYTTNRLAEIAKEIKRLNKEGEF